MNIRFLFPASLLILAACSAVRWSGSQRMDRAFAPAAEVELSTAAVQRAPLPDIPQAPRERREGALFYSDLGPDTVDVSSYPTQQRYNYGIYARTCAACHTLARSINAPMVSRGWWEFYIMGMRARSRWQGRPMSREEIKAILDFLDYDAQTRKVAGARQFEVLSDELKARFERTLNERMSDLQKKNTRPLLPGPR